MSVSGKVNSRQIWLIFRNSVLIILISAVMLCLACAGFIAAVLTQELFDQRAEFRHRLAYAYQHDHQQFPLLSEPVLIFSRSHSPLGGSVVLVYALDRHAQDYFSSKAQQLQLANTADVECVKPTIKKRWRGWKLSLHYVLPDSAYLSHHDYANHDSFYVHGAAQYLPQAERACFAVFKRFPGITEGVSPYPNFEHSYWAFSEQEGMLFSVYNTQN